METPNVSHLKPAWQPGQSGNPGGRPKKKPIADAIMAELRKAHGRSDRTKLEVAAAKLVSLMTSGKPKDVIEAFKIVMPYTDGLPVQTVELDIYDAARREAEARGLDPEKVVSILEGLRTRRAG